MKNLFNPFVSEWLAFVKNPNFTLIEKSLKTAQSLEFVDLDIERYVALTAKIGLSFKESVINIRDPLQLISMLNRHLFTNLEFSNNITNNINGNLLNRVIDTKIGIPMTLAMIYVNTASYAKLNMNIIHHGSDILVNYEDMFFDISQYCTSQRYYLDDNWHDNVVSIYDTEKILIHLLHNLKWSYARFYHYNKSMRCVDMILGLMPNLAEDIRDKGILADRLLDFDTALIYLEQYLKVEPDAKDADFILELIQNIQQRINRV